MENKELETWLSETKAKNLSKEELFDYANNNDTLSVNLFYQLRDSLHAKDLEETVDILFNQWQKESEFSPKIIGYKAPFDIFDGNLKKGQIINSLNKKSNANGIELWQTENNNEGWTLPKEIVETWEAVYEEPTELPTETDFKAKFEATIELIEKTIKEYDEAKEVAVGECDYDDASKYILIKETFEVFLKVVKEQLC